MIKKEKKLTLNGDEFIIYVEGGKITEVILMWF